MGDDSESSNFKVSHIILFYSLNIHLFIKTEIEFQVFAILQKSSNSNCDEKNFIQELDDLINNIKNNIVHVHLFQM